MSASPLSHLAQRVAEAPTGPATKANPPKSPVSPVQSPKGPSSKDVTASKSAPYSATSRTPTRTPTRTSSVASSQSTASKSTKEPDLFNKQVNLLSLDYLIAECVPLSLRVQGRLFRSEKDVSALLGEMSLEDPTFEPGRIEYMKDPKYQEASSSYKVEKYGYEIGYKVTDCLVYARSTAENANMRLQDSLEIMKFICRDVWRVFYSKQMDNLRTNHIGTFVLVDNSFRPLRNFYSIKGEEDSILKAQPFLQFPCGLIRGILASLGVKAVVTAEITKLPGVTFSIETV